MLTIKNNTAKKTKKFIRHELLNMLTVINISILDDELDEAKKEQIFDLIKLASLLIGYEDIFLGLKAKPFLQRIDLKEILEIILLSRKKKIADNNIKIILPEHIFFIKADREYIKESLEQIIKKLFSLVSGIEFKFDDQANQLIILCDKEIAPKINKKMLIKRFNKEDLRSNELGLQLALKILEMNKVKFNVKGKEIVMTFPR